MGEEAAATGSILDNYSEEQLEDIRECFKLFDKSGSGDIPSGEVINVCRCLGLAPMEKDMKKVLKQEDLAEKPCTFDQFFSIFHHFNSATSNISPLDVIECFMTVADGGIVYKFAIMSMLAALGEKMDPDSVGPLLDPYENKADNSINLKAAVYGLMNQQLPE